MGNPMTQALTKAVAGKVVKASSNALPNLSPSPSGATAQNAPLGRVGNRAVGTGERGAPTPTRLARNQPPMLSPQNLQQLRGLQAKNKGADVTVTRHPVTGNIQFNLGNGRTVPANAPVNRGN